MPETQTPATQDIDQNQLFQLLMAAAAAEAKKAETQVQVQPTDDIRSKSLSMLLEAGMRMNADTNNKLDQLITILAAQAPQPKPTTTQTASPQDEVITAAKLQTILTPMVEAFNALARKVNNPEQPATATQPPQNADLTVKIESKKDTLDKIGDALLGTGDDRLTLAHCVRKTADGFFFAVGAGLGVMVVGGTARLVFGSSVFGGA